jgi:hypothetical protein
MKAKRERQKLFSVMHSYFLQNSKPYYDRIVECVAQKGLKDPNTKKTIIEQGEVLWDAKGYASPTK